MRWDDRKPSDFIDSLIHPTMFSAPSWRYLPAEYSATASSTNSSGISSQSFWSRHRAYRYFSCLISSISTRSSGVSEVVIGCGQYRYGLARRDERRAEPGPGAVGADAGPRLRRAAPGGLRAAGRPPG